MFFVIGLLMACHNRIFRLFVLQTVYISEYTFCDWRVKTFNNKNHERWTFLFFDINKPFSHRWRVFPMIGGSFFLNMIINFIENYFAKLPKLDFDRFIKLQEILLRKLSLWSLIVIYASVSCIFSILSETSCFSVIFLALLFKLYGFVRFDFL